jgi:hypothetical protein
MRRRRPAEELAYDERATPPKDMVMPQDAVIDRAVDMPPMHPVPPVIDHPVSAGSPAMARERAVPATTLEAMIAEEPSLENPFLTRSKRKHRAMAMLREQEQANVQTVAPSTQAAPAVSTAKPVDRSQAVYSFGRQNTRPAFLKPRQLS